MRIGEEMIEVTGLGRGVQQGCCFHLLSSVFTYEEISKECFDGKRGACLGGRIKCIRFVNMESHCVITNLIKEYWKSCSIMD